MQPVDATASTSREVIARMARRTFISRLGGLIIAGGLGAIQTAMVIGALPFSVVMVLMGISLIKGIWRDSRREAAGVASTIEDDGTVPAE